MENVLELVVFTPPFENNCSVETNYFGRMSDEAFFYALKEGAYCEVYGSLSAQQLVVVASDKEFPSKGFKRAFLSAIAGQLVLDNYAILALNSSAATRNLAQFREFLLRCEGITSVVILGTKPMAALVPGMQSVTLYKNVKFSATKPRELELVVGPSPLTWFRFPGHL